MKSLAEVFAGSLFTLSTITATERSFPEKEISLSQKSGLSGLNHGFQFENHTFGHEALRIIYNYPALHNQTIHINL